MLHCNVISQSILKNFNSRFSAFLTLTGPTAEYAILAALSYPRFKNQWFSCVDASEHTRLKNLLISVITKEFSETAQPIINSNVTKEENEFFDFDIYKDCLLGKPKGKAELIIASFFSEESQDLKILNRYPEIKNIFLKYNTPLPSSAPVERLFSFATMINTPKTNKLSDQLFEERVVLKTNLNHEKNILNMVV
nr:uncharacterized protein LOC122270921 [Parasteatoda tepidariorum]